MKNIDIEMSNKYIQGVSDGIKLCKLNMIRKIDEIIKPYENVEDMLGQSILEELLKVKELLKE